MAVPLFNRAETLRRIASTLHRLQNDADGLGESLLAYLIAMGATEADEAVEREERSFH